LLRNPSAAGDGGGFRQELNPSLDRFFGIDHHADRDQMSTLLFGLVQAAMRAAFCCAFIAVAAAAIFSVVRFMGG